MVREAEQSDLDAILELYLFLHEDSIPEKDEHLRDTWLQIIQDPNHHLIVNEVGGKIISSCVCVIIPNLTRNIRPYAFIENVVTREDYRGKGYAGECLEFARQIAEKENCYKMMLLTGSKKPDTTAATRQPLYSGWEWRNKADGIIVTVNIKHKGITCWESALYPK